MKKELLFVTILLLAGIFSAQLIGKQFFSTYGFLNEYHLQIYANTKLEWLTLFWNIMWERGKLFLLIIMFFGTPLKKTLPWILKSVLFYTIGLFGTACVMNLGIKGIGVLILSLLPHGIFYLMALLVVFRMERPIIYKETKYWLKKILMIGIICVLFVIGCLIETTIGTYLLQILLKAIL